MHYIVTFHKAPKVDKKLTEKFKTRPAADKWAQLVIKNGYQVDSIKKKVGLDAA